MQRLPSAQVQANVQRMPANELTSIKTLVPFVRWGTKWTEAEPVKTISQESAVKFIFRSIICGFGIPLQIIKTQFAGSGINFFARITKTSL